MEDKKLDMTAKDIDEQLSEKEALQRASDEGIYFVDSFVIANNDSFERVGDTHKTKDDAQKALNKLENPSSYHIQQVRERKQ